MDRRKVIGTSLGGALAIMLASCAQAQDEANSTDAKMDGETKATFDTVMAFMDAMGEGEMDKMSALMADDMVWHNEGDKTLPWIGPWEGKEAIFNFLPVFSENFETKKWQNEDAFASGDTVAVFGIMNGLLKKSDQETGDFTFALRAKVRDGKVVLWNWFEDSFAVSNAYHGRVTA